MVERRTRIKVCGLTRVDDAMACARFGADFIGLVFVDTSPRHVTVTRAIEIVRAVRDIGPVSIVGVFRKEDPLRVREIARKVGLDMVQLHGDIDDDAIASIGVPVIKAYAVEVNVPHLSAHPSAAWSLFDNGGGGTGRVFDWSLLAGRAGRRPFFLAGGLIADNVADAIRQVRPDAVDVSTGVEAAPGIKDPMKVAAFIEKVRAA